MTSLRLSSCLVLRQCLTTILLSFLLNPHHKATTLRRFLLSLQAIGRALAAIFYSLLLAKMPFEIAITPSATPTTMMELPQTHLQSTDTECDICKTQEASTILKLTACNHIFHLNCIATWFRTQLKRRPVASNGTRPMCRAIIVRPTVQRQTTRRTLDTHEAHEARINNFYRYMLSELSEAQETLVEALESAEGRTERLTELLETVLDLQWRFEEQMRARAVAMATSTGMQERLQRSIEDLDAEIGVGSEGEDGWVSKDEGV